MKTLSKKMNPTYDNSRTVIITVADDRFFLSHRKEIGMTAKGEGWRVIVAGGKNGSEEAIRSMGLEYIPLPRPDRGNGVIQSLKTLAALIRLFGRYPGSVIHLVGMKMILLGNIASRLANSNCAIINAVSGLGITFSKPDSIKARIIAQILRAIWRKDGKVRTIIQNHDDEELLKHRGIVSDQELVFIKGSGVNLSEFKYRELSDPLPDGRIRVIFSGRLLRSKGVEDLIAAAEILRPEWENKAEFMICGDIHPNPDSLSAEDMHKKCDGQYIVWAGHRNDMPELLYSSRIMAFPSYYREGVPLALIEASAVGLPLVTCDSVGCRDTVDGNGFLVPPRQPEVLAERISTLLKDETLCRRLGKRSRYIAERDYDISEVVKQHLSIYNDLYNKINQGK